MKKEKSQTNIWQNLKKPILALSPMAGYTDSAFRIICLENGADIVYTEMISAEALSRGNKKILKMLNFLPEEKNIIVQLFGKNPESFAKATRTINSFFCHSRPVSQHGVNSSENLMINKKNVILNSGDPHFRKDDRKIIGLDINLGCPAHKVLKTGAGAALMDNKKLARKIIQTVIKNTNLPVSIKIRSRVKNTTAEEFIAFIKDLPITAVMIHGRSLAQGMTGEVDFQMIKKVKQLLPDKIVLGNGGVDSVEKTQEMLEKTGVDGAGIGRGALGQPWIFSIAGRHSEADEYRPRNPVAKMPNDVFYNHPDSSRYQSGRITPPLKGEDKNEFLKNIILRHAKLFLKQNQNLIPLRKHLVHYFKGQKNASEWRQKMIKVKTMEELIEILKLCHSGL